MALFTPSQSPAVVIKEIDATGGVPNVQTSTGAFVGKFDWGPTSQRKFVSNEQELINEFGRPIDSDSGNFISASYFLRYSNSMFVVRGVDSDSAKNAGFTFGDSAVPKAGSARSLIGNETVFENTILSDSTVAIARYPGKLGNSIAIDICPRTTANAAFDGWQFKDKFDNAPKTSSYDSDRDGQHTECHVVVYDKDGLITGTKKTVLEAYPYLSVAKGSKNADGTTNFIKDVINERSDYVYFNTFDSGKGDNLLTDLTPGTSKTFIDSGTFDSVETYNLTLGNSGKALGKSEYLNEFGQFHDTEQVEVDFLIAPDLDSSDHTTVVNDLVSVAQSTRKDCIVVASPQRKSIVGEPNPATITTNIIADRNGITKSSYLVMDGNYLKVYDKFNDKFIQIPAASSTAGLMAATDRTAAPWFSPAGARRGQYLGITGIDYNPTKSQRDTLYAKGVNPITNIAGGGVTLFGDRTMLERPSAFDRINVRRLFLTLERAIGRAAQNVLFEFNDEFTRTEFVNVIEPVLRDVKGRRGITDFRVVADETVNTPAVIDRNEFIANIFIKPARSINFVTLNFVAVRTGVSFEEVAGGVGV